MRRAKRNPQAGFSLIELLMVAAIMLIIAGLAIPSLVRSRSRAGEASAIATLRALFQAEARYANLFENSFSPDLNSLGKPAPGDDISTSAADLVDDVLAARLSGQPSRFTKAGYVFVYTPSGTLPSIQSYTLTADPTVRGATGINSYFVDQSGVIRFSNSRTANASDPPIH